jgi:hypothetical protein
MGTEHSRRRLLARLDRVIDEVEDIRAVLERADAAGEAEDEAATAEAEGDEANFTGCYALFLMVTEETGAAYPFVTEFVLDDDNVVWFSYLAKARRHKLLDFGSGNQEEWWPEQRADETPLDYFRRLESLDGVEKRSVMVSDWATCEMKGRFEYDPGTGAVSDHAPTAARAGHPRALTSIVGGKARDGR